MGPAAVVWAATGAIRLAQDLVYLVVWLQVIKGEGGAAQRLGLHPNTLRHRLRKLGLKRPEETSGSETARE